MIAERVRAGDLDARIDAGGHDEVAKLGEAIDAWPSRCGADRAGTPVRGRRRPRPAHAADRPQHRRQPARPRPGGRRHPRAGRAQARLVEDLLEISRLDSGTATADLRRVDLGGSWPAWPAAPGVRCTPRRVTEPDRPAPAGARDRERARQRRQPRSAADRGDGVSRADRVRDHGPGFSPAMLAPRPSGSPPATRPWRRDRAGPGDRRRTVPGDRRGAAAGQRSAGGAVVTVGAPAAMNRAHEALACGSLAAGCGSSSG